MLVPQALFIVDARFAKGYSFRQEKIISKTPRDIIFATPRDIHFATPRDIRFTTPRDVHYAKRCSYRHTEESSAMSRYIRFPKQMSRQS
jgi:hypothetical protein